MMVDVDGGAAQDWDDGFAFPFHVAGFGVDGIEKAVASIGQSALASAEAMAMKKPM